MDKSYIDEQIASAEASITAHQQKIDGLRAVAAAYPDAMPMREWWDRGPDEDYVYFAHSAHANATHISSRCCGVSPRGDDSLSNGRAQRYVIYAILQINGGEVRVYSSRPVDLIEGFKRFNDGGGKISLVDALRSTTEQAEAAVAAYQAKMKAEQEAKATKQAAEDYEKAQKVRVVEPPAATATGAN